MRVKAYTIINYPELPSDFFLEEKRQQFERIVLGAIYSMRSYSQHVELLQTGFASKYRN
jgi:hypothetical protein